VALLILLPLLISICFAIVWNVAYPRFLIQLRLHHTSAWQALGEPRFFTWGVKPPFATLRFLLRRDYFALNDARLARLGRWARAALIGALIGAALFVASGCYVVYFRTPA